VEFVKEHKQRICRMNSGGHRQHPKSNAQKMREPAPLSAVGRLFLGPVGPDFDPGTDQVIGAWCLLDAPELLERFGHAYPRPFRNGEELERTEEYLTHTVIPIVRAEVCGGLHSRWAQHIDENIDFYEDIIEPWLTWFCQNYWILYRCLKQIDERHPDSSFIVSCQPETNPPVFADTLDFARQIQSDPTVQEWLASRIVEVLATRNRWEPVYKKAVPSERKGSEQRENAGISPFFSLRQVKRAVQNQLKYYLRCSSRELPLPTMIGLSMLLALKPLGASPANLSLFSLAGIRNRHPGREMSEEDKTVAQSLVETAIRTMPSVFSHHLPSHWRRAKQIRFRKGKCRIFSSAIYDDEARIIACLARQQGEITIGVQHGGGYGCHRVFPLVRETEYQHHYFISWGWRSHENYEVNALPLPSPSLSVLADQHQPRPNGDLFFVNYALQPLVLRLHSRPFGSALVEEMGKIEAFFDRLSDEARCRIVYRPHAQNASFEDTERLIRRYPQINVHKGTVKAFLNELASCRLLVLNHPNTTFHIAMAANVPMVCYWSPDLWHFTDSCEQRLSDLRRLGVILDSSEEAAEKVNVIWPDIDKWWNRPAIQSARRRWADSYALADCGWMKAWLKTLWRL
jgi:putative transferase (TIGR04331 family)